MSLPPDSQQPGEDPKNTRRAARPALHGLASSALPDATPMTAADRPRFTPPSLPFHPPDRIQINSDQSGVAGGPPQQAVLSTSNAFGSDAQSSSQGWNTGQLPVNPYTYHSSQSNPVVPSPSYAGAPYYSSTGDYAQPPFQRQYNARYERRPTNRSSRSSQGSSTSQPSPYYQPSPSNNFNVAPQQNWPNQQFQNAPQGTSGAYQAGQSAFIATNHHIPIDSLLPVSNSNVGNAGLKTLGPDFQRMPPKYFQVGTIFEAEYPEHMGDDVSLSSYSSQQYHIKVYKFIVTQKRAVHACTVCIHTYNGKGAISKQHNDHCIVYAKDQPPPEPFEGERPSERSGGIKTKKIMVLPWDRANILDEASRINLGKVIPMDVKARVRHWGQVDGQSLKDMDLMLREVEQFWKSKNKP